MEKKIKIVMAEIFNISPEEISNETSPINVESWDSMRHLNFVVALEKEFNVEFNDDEIVALISYSTIINMLTEKVK